MVVDKYWVEYTSGEVYVYVEAPYDKVRNLIMGCLFQDIDFRIEHTVTVVDNGEGLPRFSKKHKLKFVTLDRYSPIFKQCLIDAHIWKRDKVS